MKMDDIIRRAMSELGRRSMAKLTIEERRALAGKGGRSTWAKLTPEERSVEMKRRVKIRERNRAKRLRGRPSPPKARKTN